MNPNDSPRTNVFKRKAASKSWAAVEAPCNQSSSEGDSEKASRQNSIKLEIKRREDKTVPFEVYQDTLAQLKGAES